MNDKIDEKLHKILMDVANDYANSINPELDGTLYTGPDLPTAKQEIAKLIKETLQECIDDTIENLEYDDEDYTITPVIHQLRQQAHKKLDELLK